MILWLLIVSCFAAQAAEPPPDLVARVAARESESARERGHYTYRQSVSVQEFTERGQPAGEYREVREVIFSPEGERSERLAERPVNTLKRLKLTEEDFADVRDIQPLLLTKETLPLYRVKYRGEEKIDGLETWVLQVEPKQILFGMRLFEGLLWVNQEDFSVIRSEGRAVPQIRSTRAGKENLFPGFTTVREKVGEHWFPTVTRGDDTLPFSTGPIRMRLTIRYRDYKRFGAESKILPDTSQP